MFHEKSKHIEIKFHYIMDMVQRGVVKVQYVATKEEIADVLMIFNKENTFLVKEY